MASLEKRTIGDLNCHIITAEKPECLVVLCHGFGAPGDDLVQIGTHMLETHSELMDRVVFAFPEAPLSPEEMAMYGGRAWWPLDMAQLNRAIESGDFRDLRKDSPELLPAAREAVEDVITQLHEELGLSMAQTIVGGFSQGSMLATDLTLHAEEKPAGLIIWSGTLLNEEVWQAKKETLKGLSVIQSHGTVDQILPFEASRWLETLLKEGGADVQFIEFNDGHTIPPEAMTAAVGLIRQTLAG